MQANRSRSRFALFARPDVALPRGNDLRLQKLAHEILLPPVSAGALRRQSQMEARLRPAVAESLGGARRAHAYLMVGCS